MHGDFGREGHRAGALTISKLPGKVADWRLIGRERKLPEQSLTWANLRVQRYLIGYVGSHSRSGNQRGHGAPVAGDELTDVRHCFALTRGTRGLQRGK
jgi:hypothetical protein